MARKQTNEYKTKTATSRQVTIDAVQAERRDARKARKAKSASPTFEELEAAHYSPAHASKPSSSFSQESLHALFKLARDRIQTYGHNGNTLAFITRSFQWRIASRQHGSDTARAKLHEAIEKAAPLQQAA